MTVDGDNKGEADRCFGRSDRDREDGDHHAGWILLHRSEPPESNEIQIRCREHELDPDQDKNRVAPAEGGEETDRKKGSGDKEAELQRGDHEAPPPGERESLARWFG